MDASRKSSHGDAPHSDVAGRNVAPIDAPVADTAVTVKANANDADSGDHHFHAIRQE